MRFAAITYGENSRAEFHFGGGADGIRGQGEGLYNAYHSGSEGWIFFLNRLCRLVAKKPVV